MKAFKTAILLFAIAGAGVANAKAAKSSLRCADSTVGSHNGKSDAIVKNQVASLLPNKASSDPGKSPRAIN
ncbi:MAG TPA: hypothetical protein PKC28_08450 [Bdellovibrionales bacterium]|nr:hypothetical protein [Bdellovibrionales bacterium]